MKTFVADMKCRYTDSTGQVHGPVTESELQAMYDANELSSTTQVYREGTEEWIPLNLVLREKRSSPSASALAPTMQRVTVADIDMKFTSMVLFMVKWAFAAIPAFIIIFFVLLFVLMIASVFFGGLSALFSHR